MKILLALGFLGQIVASPDPHRPVVTSTEFAGTACQVSTSSDSSTAIEGDNRTCLMKVGLDLFNRCYNGANLTFSIKNDLPSGAKGLLLVSTAIRDSNFSEPISFTLDGRDNPYEQKIQLATVSQDGTICDINSFMLVRSTLSTLDQAFTNLTILQQNADIWASELVTEYSGSGPILEPITYSGSGCGLGKAQIVHDSWLITANYGNFKVAEGGNLQCQIFVPIDLHGGCLNKIMKSADSYGQVDVSQVMTVNGNRIDWSSSSNRIFFENPRPAVCGDKINLVFNVNLHGETGRRKHGGGLYKSSFGIISMGILSQSGAASYGYENALVVPLIFLLFN